jgi:hypothetical protein
MHKLRDRLVWLAAFILFMCAIRWGTDAAIQRAIRTGWELPAWFRFLFVVGVFWKKFWLQILLLIVSVYTAATTLKTTLHHRSR